jgi:hypothetical protein
MRTLLLITGIAATFLLSCGIPTQSGTPGIIQNVTYELLEPEYDGLVHKWCYHSIKVRADIFGFEDADAYLLIHNRDKELTIVNRIDSGDITQVVFTRDYLIYEGDLIGIRVESYIGGEQVDEWRQEDIEVPPAIG